MVKHKVPFYPNTKDDTHCVQACARSILKYFLPNKNFTFKELDKLSSKVEGKGTWWFPLEIALTKIGFDVIEISPFDYGAFLSEGEGYLYKAYRRKQAVWYIKYSNISDVKDHVEEFIRTVKPKARTANLRDFERFLGNGYLVMSDVNYFALHGQKGYGSHAVLLYGFDEDNFYLHDPGLPPRRAVIIKKNQLIKAGGDNLVAFKYMSAVMR